nr:endochitinase EP3-like [Ipomoea batatas]
MHERVTTSWLSVSSKLWLVACPRVVLQSSLEVLRQTGKRNSATKGLEEGPAGPSWRRKGVSYTRKLHFLKRQVLPQVRTTGKRPMKQKAEIAAFFRPRTHETGHLCYIREINGDPETTATQQTVPCAHRKDVLGRGTLPTNPGITITVPPAKASGVSAAPFGAINGPLRVQWRANPRTVDKRVE